MIRFLNVVTMTDLAISIPLLTIFAAVLFGGSANAVRAGLNSLDSRTGAIISISATTFVYLLALPFWIRFDDLINPGLLLFAGFGFLHPWLSRYMAYEANRRVGATVSSTFEANSPLLTAAFAVVFLGEVVTLTIAVGTLLTVAGIVWIFWNREVAVSIMRTAALLAFGAMVLRAGLVLISKVGLTLMPNPLVGAFATYAVSLMCALSFHYVKAGGGRIPFFTTGASWFMLAGLSTAFGTFLLFTALLHGQVVIVSPILASYPLFTMLIAWMIGTEHLRKRVILGVVVVVVGVVLISLGGHTR